MYDGLPHGFGLGTGTVAEGWIDEAATDVAAENVQAVYSVDGKRVSEGSVRKGIYVVKTTKGSKKIAIR